MSVRDTVRDSWQKRFAQTTDYPGGDGPKAADGGDKRKSHQDLHAERDKNDDPKIHSDKDARGKATNQEPSPEVKRLVIVLSDEETDDPDKHERESNGEEQLKNIEEPKEIDAKATASNANTATPTIATTEEEDDQEVEIMEEIEDDEQIEELGDNYEEIQESFHQEARGMSGSKTVSIISDGVEPEEPARKKQKKFEYIELSDGDEKNEHDTKGVKPPPPFKPFHNPLYDKPPLRSAITIYDIFSNPNIDTSYLFTYYIELKEFLSYYKSPETNIKVIIQSDHILDAENLSRKYTNLSILKVNMKPYTSHHCKIILNKYKNGEWKIYLTSCNLMRAELLMNNQLSWESPPLPKLGADDKDSSRFKHSFIGFLKGYKPLLGNQLNPLITELDNINFNSIIGDFISSVPIRTKFNESEEYGFGFKGLANTLKLSNLIKPKNIDILCQSSSIASALNYEKKTNKVSNILTHLILPYLTSPNPLKLSNGADSFTEYLTRNNITLHIVYPTLDNILLSKFGSGSGTWSSFNGYGNAKAQAQLQLLKPYFYKPYSKQREYNTSHTKFIIASSDGFKTLDWCLFTTANISKQAWGNILRSGAQDYVIENFESGVLISKEHYKGYNLIPLGIGEDDTLRGKSLAADEIGVILPFDIKGLKKYEGVDKPWCIQGYNANE